MWKRLIGWIKGFIKKTKQHEETALLVVDAPNVEPIDLRHALAQMKTICSNVRAVVYLPISEKLKDQWEPTCKDIGVEMKEIPVYVTGKVSSDSFLSLEAVGMCLENKYSHVGILSSDTDFLHLVRFLDNNSKNHLNSVKPLLFIDEKRSNSSVSRFVRNAYVKNSLGYERKVYSPKPRPKLKNKKVKA